MYMEYRINAGSVYYQYVAQENMLSPEGQTL